MEIKLAYGRDKITVQVPASVEVHTYSSRPVERPVDYAVFKTAFNKSGAGSFLSSGQPLVVVNDGYRRTPTARTLDWLDRLDRTLLDRASFLVATGAHNLPTEEHLRKIFGSFIERVKPRLFSHDARDRESLYRLGYDRMGGEVLVNRLIRDSKKVFIIGSVEPHYFAGFTGGCKSLFPGVADLATIERNHNLANSLEAAPLKVEDNPVAEHLWSLYDLLDEKKFCTVQLVADGAGQTAAVFFGDLRNAFREASTCARTIFAPPLKMCYDVVLCEVRSPLDKNLYQAQKALENCQEAVIDGGEAVVVSACEEGVGSEYFFDLAGKWDVKQNRACDGRLHFGSHKLSRVNTMRRRIGVRLHSELDDAVVRRVFYDPVGDLNDYLNQKTKDRDKM
ncbi:MAG: lactate racemase domain-containing protein, partial [Candidatus Zixiibacteriota bacterium]